jgi:hypothetical protein
MYDNLQIRHHLPCYITNIDEKLIKDDVIELAVQSRLIPILGETFYNEILYNSIAYSSLLDKYIKPFLAHYVKYLLYSQQLFETAQYSNPDPSKAQELIDPSIVTGIDPAIHWSILKSILYIARQKEQLLIDYLNQGHYELYTPPTSKRISGIIINT